MSFYNFKLSDASSFSTSSPSDPKNGGRFVHKTFEDFQSKNKASLSPHVPVSPTVMTNDGRGKFALVGWRDKKTATEGAENARSQVKSTPSTVRQEEFPSEIHALSITTSLQRITHTYSPLNIATLNSLGSPTSIRIVKLSGPSMWHSHDNTDEIFILLKGAICVHYRGRSGEEKIARAVGGELLRVPMGMEHCVVADEGTDVILLEGKDTVTTCLDCVG